MEATTVTSTFTATTTAASTFTTASTFTAASSTTSPINNRWNENKQRIKHNREMLQKLKEFQFPSQKEEILPLPKPPAKPPTKERDAQELNDLVFLCETTDVELQADVYDRFKVYLNDLCENNVEAIRKYYCYNLPLNSHFRLNIYKSMYRVSYRNGYFYYLDEYPETILSYKNEVGRLIKAFRSIKNSNELSNFQLMNSVKIKHSLKAEALYRTLHSTK